MDAIHSIDPNRVASYPQRSDTAVRYWKGSYHEDTQDHKPRPAHDLQNEDSERREMRWFHALIAIQIALVSLAVLLFVGSR